MSQDVSYTEDRLLDGRVVIRQPVTGYRVAVDPILLAAAVPARAGHVVLDAGCGTGAAMFCLAARVPGIHVVGLELQPPLAKFASAGIGLNQLAGSAQVITGNLAGVALGAYDVVMTNPPFAESGTPPPDASLAVAHMEGNLDLAAWLTHCLAALKPKGRLVIVHRADRLSDILGVLHGRAGDIRIRAIHPKTGQPARRVIVDAGKGRRSPDTLLPGLVLHDDDGGYTPAAEAVLRGASAL